MSGGERNAEGVEKDVMKQRGASSESKFRSDDS